MELNVGEEQAPAGEAEVVGALVALQTAIMRKSDATRRGQHAKHHGCTTAVFVVRDDIPAAYARGLFEQAATFHATVRFSNSGQPDDTSPDVHGMAVKVFGVNGPRALEGVGGSDQDFVLMDSEVFFARDPQMVLEVMKARVAAASDPGAMPAFAAKHPDTAALLNAIRKTIASPLTVRYFSTVPFKLGDGAVKYMAVPSADNGPGNTQPTSKDYLRQAMVEQLTDGNKPAVFELFIIPQTDPKTMPIEDPTVAWNSVPVPVATITVNPQTFAIPEHLQVCENLSFDPWHALAEHRPLGGINRARKAVYEASVKLRRGSRQAAPPIAARATP